MGRALTDQGNSAVRAPFVEAGDARLVWKASPAFGAKTRSDGAHRAAAPSPSPAPSPSSRAASGPAALSAPSSLALHLDLLI